jgi:AraC family transcriptional regulator
MGNQSVQLGSTDYFGAAIKENTVAGIRLLENVYAPERYIPLHAHENASISFLLQGYCDDSLERKQRYCRPSTLIFHPAGESQTSRYHRAGGRLFVIDLSTPWVKRIREHAPVPDTPAVVTGTPFAVLAWRLYQEFRAADEVSGLAIEGLLLEILAGAARSEAKQRPGRIPPWVDRARELIRCRFAERLSLEGIAQEVGRHPVHLARSFREHCGSTLGEFQRQVRVEFAMRELARAKTPLSEIALAAGFSDQSHFSNIFKRHTGMNPAQFRAAAQTP